jgi:hypothetical protein
MKPVDLLPQVYDELRKLAAAKLASEKPGQTLDATALVHQAFLKLGGERSFAGRSDYLKAAAQAMRRILVDRARARNAVKRRGGRRVDFEPHHLAVPPPDDNVEALDDAFDVVGSRKPANCRACPTQALWRLDADPMCRGARRVGPHGRHLVGICTCLACGQIEGKRTGFCQLNTSQQPHQSPVM